MTFAMLRFGDCFYWAELTRERKPRWRILCRSSTFAKGEK